MKSAAHPHISFPVLTCLFTLKMRERKALCSLSALQSYQPQEEAPKEPNEMSLVTIWLFWATEEKVSRSFLPFIRQGLPMGPTAFLSGHSENNSNRSGHPLSGHQITKNT